MAGTLIDCTFSGNSASVVGGGLYGGLNSGTTLTDCTISGNSAGKGGGLYNTISTVTLGNTIVAGNTASSSGPDVLGTFSSQGNNLIGETDGSSGWVGSDLTGTIASPLDPLLAPLAYYGGPTETMPLLPGSPAIGAGNIALIPGGITTDERGYARIESSTVDIGAYEGQAIPLVVTTAAQGIGCPLGTLDLRGAIDLANILPGANTITFDPTFFSGAQTITLTGSQLTLSNTTGTQTITGPAAGVTVSGGGLSRVFEVEANVTASISGLTISGGNTAGHGGGMYNDGGMTTLTDCTVSGNTAFNGGGVYSIGGSAMLTLTDCTVSGNTADYDGGLVNNAGTARLTNCTVSDNFASNNGGGVGNTGTTTLTDCTVSANSAGGDGGGMFNLGAAVLTLTNCTVSGNSASEGGGATWSNGAAALTDCTVSGNSGQVGGGLYIRGGTTALTDCTVSGNSATDGGGLDCNASAKATIANTIVAGNTTTTSAPDVSGAFTSGGHNVIGATNGSTGWVGSDLTGTGASPLDPLLSPLGNYGGPTPTMALLPGSPAISNGIVIDYPGTSTPISIDERGMPRGSLVDIGAVQCSLVVESPAGSVDTSTAGLTLPGAVLLANQFAGSAITFDPAFFGTHKSITLSAQLELSNAALATSITGPAAGVEVSGGGTTRVFQVDGNVTAALSGLTISGGSTTGYGGGLYNDGGGVTLSSVTISSNVAGKGGGLFNTGRGTIGITSCSITGNSAANGAGLYNDYGTATLTGVTISSNIAGKGGGLFNTGRGTIGITSCSITGNSATKGGGLYNYQGTTSLNGGTVSGNSGASGGGLFNTGRGTIGITSCSITGNSATSAGGGLYNYQGAVTFNGGTVSGNTGASGGGLFNTGRGTIGVTGCSVTDNSATSGGGGIYNDGGMVTLTGVTVSGNIAGKGGGVFNTGRGTIGITSCTVGDNSAGSGGGLYNYDAAANLDATTIGGNSAASGGGIDNMAGGSATLEDTIVATNTGTGGSASDIGGDSSSGVVGTYDLVGTGSAGGIAGGTGDIVLSSLSNLGLASLGNYGGSAATMPLLPGSAAIDSGTTIPGVSTDQRGLPPSSPTPDIGAVSEPGIHLLGGRRQHSPGRAHRRSIYESAGGRRHPDQSYRARGGWSRDLHRQSGPERRLGHPLLGDCDHWIERNRRGHRHGQSHRRPLHGHRDGRWGLAHDRFPFEEPHQTRLLGSHQSDHVRPLERDPFRHSGERHANSGWRKRRGHVRWSHTASLDRLDRGILRDVQHRRPPRCGLSLSGQLCVYERRDLRLGKHDDPARGHAGHAHDHLGQPRWYHLWHRNLGQTARCGGGLDGGRSEWSGLGVVQLHAGRRQRHLRRRPDPLRDFHAHGHVRLQRRVRLGDDQCRQGDTQDRLGEPRRDHLRHRAFGDPARCDIVVDGGGRRRKCSGNIHLQPGRGNRPFRRHGRDALRVVYPHGHDRLQRRV